VASTIGRLTAVDRVPAGDAPPAASSFEGMRVEPGGYLTALLAVVLEAAVQARRAKAGSLLLLTADRTTLVREASHGLTQCEPAERIPVGQGVAGTVAATGRAMVLASPAGNGGSEPTATTQVSVPVAAHTFARYGGEEFVLILPETNLEGGLAVAEKLRLATHRTPFCGKGADGGVLLTVSIGVACFPEHATQPEELLRAADEALYEAKLQGRDRVVTAGPRLLPLAARPGQVKGRTARVE
jgi:hypothetical protein